jgi:hypothetical protein
MDTEREHLHVRHGTSLRSDEQEAVAELREQIAQESPFATLFFCSPQYDLPHLARALRAAFPGSLHGCTSAGQLGPQGFQRGGITAISLGPQVRVTSHTIQPLGLVGARAAEIGHRVHEDRAGTPPGTRTFGLLLVDGLSLAEERVASSLYHALGNTPIIGGSAGDDLAFQGTYVFVNGEFTQDAAELLLFETSIPFRIFKLQHFVPTDTRLVITAAEPDRRRVVAINGEPAAEEYARLIGRRAEELTADVFSQHPLLLRIGHEYYVRSFQKANPDRSLTVFAAIEEGIVLRIGRGVDALETLEEALGGSHAPDLVLGCDCILRRLEFEQRGLDGQVSEILRKHHVFGFSTYGEQFNAIHVNQTFTGVAIGGSPDLSACSQVHARPGQQVTP